LPEHDVIKAVVDIQRRWFGETAEFPTEAKRSFGSKLVLTDEAARRWPEELRQRMRSAAHQKAGAELAQWRAHRDHLAAALCAVTGARPNSWLGEIELDQIIPEFALVIITDKASDMLRQTRVAATGWRWVADFRHFLTRLATLAGGAAGADAAGHAERILRSEAPVFSLPEDQGGRLTVAALRNSMPAPLRDVPNHYRHRLNQCLQRHPIDPELRHAQLGWVVTPAHTLSDLSQWSAKAFGIQMASILDDIMVRDGWYPATQRTPNWTWAGLPERPLKDWEAVVNAHLSEHSQNVRRLKSKLVERWKSVSADVCVRLSRAFAEYFPGLKLDVEKRRLEWAPHRNKREPEEMSGSHYGLLCEHVRRGDKEPDDAAEGIAARVLLFRIILSARRRGVVNGPLPSRPVLSVTDNPSPFLPRLGLAVRHAEALRERLLARAREGRDHDMGSLVTTSVLAYSAYRHFDQAVAAVGAAAGASRSQGRPDCVRVPAMIERRLVPMAFGGLPAVLLVRRRQQEPPPPRPTEKEHVGRWLRKALARTMPLPESDAECVRLVESLFQAVGRLELSGPERTVMLGRSTLASVSVERSLARDDDWPLRTAVTAQLDTDDAPESVFEDEPAAAATARPYSRREVEKGYARLTAALNPDRLPTVSGSTSDSHHGWRGRLASYLGRLQSEFDGRTNLGLLIGFTQHRLRYGGRRKTKLAHHTLASTTRFAPALLAVAGSKFILDWDADEFRANYLAVLVGKRVTTRRQAFDALAEFHAYLVEVHDAPDISLAELATYAGERIQFVDPGMLTPREVARVLEELRADLDAEKARADAAPETVRLLSLREIMFVLLEGSGIRPSSAYGLTLADVVLLAPDRDFLRIRTSGGYGRAKSTASLGFIPLEGSLWKEARDRVNEWVLQEKQLQPVDAPLFAKAPGERRRFGRAYLTRRIDELLKWVTADRNAHTYWLRKNRITARHERVTGMTEPMARDAYAALSTSGHVLIETPLQSYISDPAIALHRQLRDGGRAARSEILAVANQKEAPLDMAWHRSGGADSTQRMATVLNRIRLSNSPLDQVLTDPPRLKRRETMTPRHVDAYARARHRHRDRTEALIQCALSVRQADELDRLAALYFGRRGEVPWPVAPGGHRRVLKPPRRLAGTEELFAALSTGPTEDAVLLAEAYSTQGHSKQLHASDIVMTLPTAAEVDAARRFLQVTDVGMDMTVSSGFDALVIRGGEDNRKSHAAAVRWFMAIVWIFHRSRGH